MAHLTRGHGADGSIRWPSEGEMMDGMGGHLVNQNQLNRRGEIDGLDGLSYPLSLVGRPSFRSSKRSARLGPR